MSEDTLPPPALSDEVIALNERLFSENEEVLMSQLTSIALGLTRDPVTAADLVQVSMLAGWRQLNVFRGPEDNNPEERAKMMRVWLARILTNQYKMSLRRQKPVASLDASVGTSSEPFDDGRHTEQAEMRTYIAELMKAAPLNDDQKMALHLRYWEDLSTDEIAERLGITGGNARVILSRARAALRQAAMRLDQNER